MGSVAENGVRCAMVRPDADGEDANTETPWNAGEQHNICFCAHHSQGGRIWFPHNMSLANPKTRRGESGRNAKRASR